MKSNKRTFKLEFSTSPLGFYRVDVTDEDEGASAAIVSPSGDLYNTRERRKVLDMFFGLGSCPFACLLRKRMFPNDTQIFDQEVTVNGVKLSNPRYPDEPGKTNQTPTTDSKFE